MLILLPLFILSGVLAYFLIKQIDRDEKRKGRECGLVAKRRSLLHEQTLYKHRRLKGQDLTTQLTVNPWPKKLSKPIVFLRYKTSLICASQHGQILTPDQLDH